MKKILALLALAFCAPIYAQTAPVTITKANNVYTFKNVSTKTITLVVGDQSFPTGQVTAAVIDFLFKARALAPGDTHDQQSTSTSIALTFVQFSDGTTWGTSSGASAQGALAKRKAVLKVLPPLATAASETDFVNALNQPQPDDDTKLVQTMYQMDVQSSGASVAWSAVKLRWSVAQSRQGIWNF